MYLSVFLFVFIMIGVNCISSVCNLIVFVKLRDFSDIVCSNTSSAAMSFISSLL